MYNILVTSFYLRMKHLPFPGIEEIVLITGLLGSEALLLHKGFCKLCQNFRIAQN